MTQPSVGLIWCHMLRPPVRNITFCTDCLSDHCQSQNPIISQKALPPTVHSSLEPVCCLLIFCSQQPIAQQRNKWMRLIHVSSSSHTQQLRMMVTTYVSSRRKKINSQTSETEYEETAKEEDFVLCRKVIKNMKHLKTTG